MRKQRGDVWATVPLPLTLVVVIVVILAGIADETGARSTSSPQGSRSRFKAAVYSHKAFIPLDVITVSRARAVKNMRVNLDIYRRQATEAGRQGAQILVFPEDGVYGMKHTRQTISPYLEYMPDPQLEPWIPCDDPTRYPKVEVQVALSCMARDNQLYLVANIGDKQPCQSGDDPMCPRDKRYQYNTDVAYGPDGTFLAKYHKHNLYKEHQFDRADPVPVYFDTPFGRFGMMTCFDVLFREPGISLVEKHNVTNVAFPTAWMDALSTLSAIGFHSSFARAHGINFLSANIHLPSFRFVGSGLYGPDGAHGVYYSNGEQPKLVLADMDVISAPTRGSGSGKGDNSKGEATSAFSDQVSADLSPVEEEFSAVLHRDTYTFRTLDQPSANIDVCQGKVCCHLEYAKSANDNAELFAFGVFDGLHVSRAKDSSYYMQVCALVKCADAEDRKSCGRLTKTSSTSFSKISIHGEFQTEYVYPQILLSDSQGQLGISAPGAWDFTGSGLETRPSFNATVLDALLIGRDYSRDDMAVGSRDPSSRPLASSIIIIFGLIVAGLSRIG